jgi:hypothetical protein
MKNKYPMIFKRIQRCKFCLKEMSVAPLAFQENPFCNQCLDQRIALEGVPLGQGKWERVRHYLQFRPTTPQRPI